MYISLYGETVVDFDIFRDAFKFLKTSGIFNLVGIIWYGAGN